MSFFADLWDSIFVPGTTPTLVLATNISFFLLQILLVVLLITTGSYHFLAMSILCGGLWAGIRWFVRELEELNRLEAEKSKSEKSEGGEDIPDNKSEGLEDKKDL